MIEIITMNDNNKYEVVHIYELANGQMFSEDLIRVMKKKCDNLIRSGNKFFACNKIEDAIWEDIVMSTQESQSNNTELIEKQVDIPK
jgi:hypothetical protein